MKPTSPLRVVAPLFCAMLLSARLLAAEPITPWQPSTAQEITLSSQPNGQTQIVSRVAEFTVDSAISLPAKGGDAFAVEVRTKVGIDMQMQPELACFDAQGREIPPPVPPQPMRQSTTQWQKQSKTFIAWPNTATVRARVRGYGRGTALTENLAVFDERIKVIVSSCGFDSFLDYLPRLWNPGQGWAQQRYMPKILNYERHDIPFDLQELAGSLAPRAFYINAPINDGNFHWQSVARIVAASRPVYQLFGVPGLLRGEHPDVAHEFPSEIRAEAYDWIEQFL